MPKTEYIYGCEVHNAVELMKNSMDNRHKIPSKWWNDNNNKTFTLPFDSKARLQRATTRSNINGINVDCIYPFRGTRQKSNIHDKFKLNYENGLFIGLFISEGNINKNSIYITNLDDKIVEFVKAWFDMFNIEYSDNTKINNIGGSVNGVNIKTHKMEDSRIKEGDAKINGKKIRGYPTVKISIIDKKGKRTELEYNGKRNADDLYNYFTNDLVKNMNKKM
jgi:hypothetical protein